MLQNNIYVHINWEQSFADFPENADATFNCSPHLDEILNKNIEIFDIRYLWKKLLSKEKQNNKNSVGKKNDLKVREIFQRILLHF